MKFFMHTPKAVRKQDVFTGCMPADRLFIVQNEFKDGRRTYYNAWKGRLTSQGLIHPGINGVLPINELSLATLELVPDVAKNGAEPTAQFYKDSFYREVTWDDVRAICAARPSAEAPVTQHAVISELRSGPVLSYTVVLEVVDDPAKIVAIRRLMKKLHENLEAL